MPPDIPVATLVTYQQGIGVVILPSVTDLNNIENIMADEYVAAGLVFGLGVLGIGVAYILYYYIIDKPGAVAASSVAYAPPIVALVIGGLIVGERIVFWEYLGAAFILLGVVLINRKTVN